MNILSLWIIEWYISFPKEIGDEIFWRTNGDVMFKEDTVTCISFRLEPRAGKLARVVPRGERTSNGPDLPDKRKFHVAFLGGKEPVMVPTYPTRQWLRNIYLIFRQ